MERQTTWLIPIVLAVGAAGALWYYWMQVSEPAPAPSPPPPPVAATPAPQPAAPVPAAPAPMPEAPVEEPAELVPLPPLDESDAWFALELADVFGAAVEDVLVESGLIERIVATVDNLPRQKVAERIRPVGRLDSPFVVDGQDDSGEYFINSSSFERYDGVIAMIEVADLDQLGDVYRRFYPLFQKSYEDLGYPDGYFNDRLVEVIDDLLATPDVADSVMLVRPHVLYEYADPELEALSSGQKLLVRMGSEHRSQVKRALRELRSIVTAL